MVNLQSSKWQIVRVNKTIDSSIRLLYMCNVWDAFNDYIRTELEAFNITVIFDRLRTEYKYDLDDLRHLLLYTIYNENNKTQSPHLQGLSHCLNLLNDDDERPKLMLPQLLFMVALCDRAINERKSNNNLYI